MTTSTSHNPSETLKTRELLSAYDLGLRTASGALGAYLFSIISPIGGAIFGLASSIVCTMGYTSLDPVQDPIIKLALYAPMLFCGIATGMIAVSAAGFPLTFVSAFSLSLAMVPALCIVEEIAKCFRTRLSPNHSLNNRNFRTTALRA